ncbi:MAG: ribonuclease H-like domain-containing protein, partial [Gemmataceae bacterium]|nr:ribonuclease H-like domain-containing protein [Gemmataceae bacterium]
DIQNYRLLISYNGKSFDIPFIETYFNIRVPQAHIDLRYPLKSLGLQGGLKGVEKQLGINRDELNDVNGYDAVLLWNEYKKKGDKAVLDTLLAYNIQDTIVLHTLMVHTHNEKIKTTPFAKSYTLRKPELPEIPFKADFNIVRRVRMGSFGY